MSPTPEDLGWRLVGGTDEEVRRSGADEVNQEFRDVASDVLHVVGQELVP